MDGCARPRHYGAGLPRATAALVWRLWRMEGGVQAGEPERRGSRVVLHGFAGVGIAERGRPDERRHVQVRVLFDLRLEQEQRDPAIFIVHTRRKLRAYSRSTWLSASLPPKL